MNMETSNNTYKIVDQIGQCDWYIGDDFDSADKLDIYKHWRHMGMKNRPDLLSEKDVRDALLDCDKNIEFAENLLRLAKKSKEQVSGLKDTASLVSAGEKEYENVSLTPQNILDFLESILVTNKDNAKEIYKLYNDYIKKEFPASHSSVFLTSPSDLVFRGRIKGKNDVRFEVNRQSGGNVSFYALRYSLSKFMQENYPEIEDYLNHPRGYQYKKNFTVQLKRYTMSSINKSWKRIFIKYAEWVTEND